MVPGQVEEDGQAGGQDLTQDGGQGGSRHLHPGEAEQSEDQNGVHDDVDNGAHRLGDHGVEGAPGGLEHPVKGDLYEQPYRQAADDGHVLCAVVHNGLLAGLHLEKEPGAGQADGHEHQAAEDGQKQAVHGGGVGPALAALAQALGQQGVDAHAGSHGHGDHQILDREGQRDGVQRVLADLGHKVAVHHVVEGLHQHGDHHGDGHARQELADGHDAHFILLGRCGSVVFHVLRFLSLFFRKKDAAFQPRLFFGPVSFRSIPAALAGLRTRSQSPYFFFLPLASWVR